MAIVRIVMNDTPIINNEITDKTLKVITDEEAITTTPDNITLNQVESPVTKDVSRNSFTCEVDVNALSPVDITVDTPGVITTDPPIIEGCQNVKENCKLKILDIGAELKNDVFPLEISNVRRRGKQNELKNEEFDLSVYKNQAVFQLSGRLGGH